MTKTNIYNYRGLHAQHPALDAAKQGTVIPGNPNGKVSPAEHNRGGLQHDSPYTSWTQNKQVAKNNALRNGPGGVILSIPTGAPLPHETWFWVWSPDIFLEEEVLLHGERSGATVELL